MGDAWCPACGAGVDQSFFSTQKSEQNSSHLQNSFRLKSVPVVQATPLVIISELHPATIDKAHFDSALGRLGLTRRGLVAARSQNLFLDDSLLLSL